jgi:hypothetical protein
MTHGWPGSVAEFAKVIEPLTDPVANGETPRRLRRRLPSLPSYRFSDDPAEPERGVERIADAWAVPHGASWLPGLRRSGRLGNEFDILSALRGGDFRLTVRPAATPLHV